MGPPLSAGRLAGTSQLPKLSLPAGAVGTVAAGTPSEVGGVASSATNRALQVIETLSSMRPPRVLPPFQVVVDIVARTEGRLNLRNVPYFIGRGLLRGFIRELATAYLSDKDRYTILADIRQRTLESSVLQPALAALLSDLKERPVNCARSQKYIAGWLAALRSPPAPVRPPMARSELNRLLWPGASEDGWTGVEISACGKKRRYRHKSSAKHVFTCKKDARAYNDENVSSN